MFVNFLNSASAFAGNVYDAFRTPAEIKNYKENYGPVSPSFGGAPGSYEITNDGKPFGGYTVEQVKSEYNTEISESAAAFILSMIPILGDGSGIIKELYNLHMTGEMDELNFTLSLIGLAMDLPFDGGILGDTAVATLKAVSTMIPSGPARQVMLEALQQVGKNPEGLIAMAGAFGKMAGNDDLMKIITSNPEVFKAYLNGGAEAAENLLKYEDEIIQAGKAIGADELLDIMDGGKAALHSTDEIAEVGAKVVASSTDEVVETGAKVLLDSDVLYNYDAIRAYNGIDSTQIPIEYRADPNLMTEMEFKGKGMSGTNSAGWERDASKHFEYLLDNHPEFWSDANITRIENGVVPVVDDIFIKSFPQYKNQIGDKLIHHHVGGGGQAVAMPESLHQGFGGVHNVEKVLGITGNDPLTDIGQSFVDQLE